MPIVVDHDERRDMIAGVVERVIAEHGMDAVTIRNIAREAGFRSTLISHYFKDKKDMLLYTLRSINTRAVTRVDREFMEKNDLAACMDTLLPTNDNGLRDWQTWFGFWELATYDPDFTDIRRQVVEATDRLLKDILERASARGELPADLDSDFHARRLQIFMNGLSAQVIMNPDAWSCRNQHAMLAAEIELIRLMPRPAAGTPLPDLAQTLEGAKAVG